MAAVRREAKAPPPIPFPWTRAAPGIAAALLLVVLAVASLVTGTEAPPRTPVALERAVEITAKIGNSVASWDARSASIWVVVAALSAVPILAPLALIRDERKA
jgi:hypothetical protein